MKDITVIGAGPVGLYACIYAEIREMSVNLIDSMHQPGGKLTTLFADKFIYDLASYDQIRAQDYINNLTHQLEENNNGLVDMYLNQEVLEIKKKDDHFEIVTNVATYTSKTVLLTTGSGMISPRKMGLENEEQYENVVYSVQNINDYKDKKVVILGGGDSALDWALMLNYLAKEVDIVHRRLEYRAKEGSIKLLNQSKVNQHLPFIPVELKGNGDKLESLVIENKDTNERKELSLDVLLVNYGSVTKIADFGGLGLEKNHLGYLVNRTFETNVPGIYACGDAINYEGRPNIISVGLGEVPVAINNIKGYIDPSSKNKIFYSSVNIQK